MSLGQMLIKAKWTKRRTDYSQWRPYKAMIFRDKNHAEYVIEKHSTQSKYRGYKMFKIVRENNATTYNLYLNLVAKNLTKAELIGLLKLLKDKQ